MNYIYIMASMASMATDSRRIIENRIFDILIEAANRGATTPAGIQGIKAALEANKSLLLDAIEKIYKDGKYGDAKLTPEEANERYIPIAKEALRIVTMKTRNKALFTLYNVMKQNAEQQQHFMTTKAAPSGSAAMQQGTDSANYIPMTSGTGGPAATLLTDLLSWTDRVHDAFDKKRNKQKPGPKLIAQTKVWDIMQVLQKRGEILATEYEQRQPSKEEELALYTFTKFFHILKRKVESSSIGEGITDDKVKEALTELCKESDSLIQYYSVISFLCIHSPTLHERGIIISADKGEDAWQKFQKIFSGKKCIYSRDRGASETFMLLQTQTAFLNELQKYFRMAAKNSNKTLIISDFDNGPGGKKYVRKDMRDTFNQIRASDERQKCSEIGSFGVPVSPEYKTAEELVQQWDAKKGSSQLSAVYMEQMGGKKESVREKFLKKRYQDYKKKYPTIQPIFPYDFLKVVSDGQTHTIFLDPETLIFCETFVGVDMHSAQNNNNSPDDLLMHYGLKNSFPPNRSQPLVGTGEDVARLRVCTPGASDPAGLIYRGGFTDVEARAAEDALNLFRTQRSQVFSSLGTSARGQSLPSGTLICQSNLLLASHGVYSRVVNFPKTGSTAMPANVQVSLKPDKSTLKYGKIVNEAAKKGEQAEAALDLVPVSIKGVALDSRLATLTNIRNGGCGNEEYKTAEDSCATGTGCACLNPIWKGANPYQDHMNCWSGSGKSPSIQKNQKKVEVNWCPCHGAYISNILGVIKNSTSLFNALQNVARDVRQKCETQIGELKEEIAAISIEISQRANVISGEEKAELEATVAKLQEQLKFLNSRMIESSGSNLPLNILDILNGGSVPDIVAVRIPIPSGQAAPKIRSTPAASGKFGGRPYTQAATFQFVLDNDNKVKDDTGFWSYDANDEQYYFSFNQSLSEALKRSARRENLVPDIPSITGDGLMGTWQSRLRASGTIPQEVVDSGKEEEEIKTADGLDFLEENGLGICCTACICKGKCIGNQLWGALGLSIIADYFFVYGHNARTKIKEDFKQIGLPISALVTCVEMKKKELVEKESDPNLEIILGEILRETNRYLRWNDVGGNEMNKDKVTFYAEALIALVPQEDDASLHILVKEAQDFQNKSKFKVIERKEVNCENPGDKPCYELTVKGNNYDGSEEIFTVLNTELGRTGEEGDDDRPLKYKDPKPDTEIVIPYNILAQHLADPRWDTMGTDLAGRIDIGLRGKPLDWLTPEQEKAVGEGGKLNVGYLVSQSESIMNTKLLESLLAIRDQGSFNSGDGNPVENYMYTGENVCTDNAIRALFEYSGHETQHLHESIWWLVNYIIYKLNDATNYNKEIIAETNEVFVLNAKGRDRTFPLNETIKLNALGAGALGPIITAAMKVKPLSGINPHIWGIALDLAIQCLTAIKTYGDLHQLTLSFQIPQSGEFIPTCIIYLTGDYMGTALAATYKSNGATPRLCMTARGSRGDTSKGQSAMHFLPMCLWEEPIADPENPLYVGGVIQGLVVDTRKKAQEMVGEMAPGTPVQTPASSQVLSDSDEDDVMATISEGEEEEEGEEAKPSAPKKPRTEGGKSLKRKHRKRKTRRKKKRRKRKTIRKRRKKGRKTRRK